MIKGRKILQILPELNSGGVERGTIEVAQAIQEAGAQAYVASAGGKMVEGLKRCGARHIELPLASKNPYTIWTNIHRLQHLMKQEEIDLAHARSRAPAWSAYCAAQATNTPFVTTFHGVYNGYENQWKQRYNEIMTRGDKVIAVSNFVSEHIKKYYPEADTKRIEVIHRGADIDYFDPEQITGLRTIELLKQWHAPDDLPIILMPGRLTRWKGQHVLLEALSQLSHREFFCIMLGEPGKHPGYVRELEKMTEKYKLTGHVRMVGTTQHMRAAYNAASVVISPAIEPEAFGRVPVEAQAMGKPVIATSHGGAMETVVTGETGTGWLVPPGDATALSHTIKQALHLSDADKDALAYNARSHVIENFSTAKMCEKVLGVYGDVLRDKEVMRKVG